MKNVFACFIRGLKIDPNTSVLDAPIPNDEPLPDIDEEIKKRLQVVKQPTNDLDQPSSNSERDMAERLANLKGVKHKEYDHRAMLNAVDKRTEQEMANDLIKQFASEVSIDQEVEANYEDPIQSIERRLAALKGSPISSPAEQKNPLDESPVDEETMAKKIVNKVSINNWEKYW